MDGLSLLDKTGAPARGANVLRAPLGVAADGVSSRCRRSGSAALVPAAASSRAERGRELRNCCLPTLQMTLRLLGTGYGNDLPPVAL